jgi:hypothetical protein
MSEELIYANGINGLTGEYLLPPLEPSDVAARARESPYDPEQKQLEEIIGQASFGPPFDVRPENVAEAGWAIVFGSDETAAVKRALEPLIEHRRRQIGDKARVLEHRPGERWPQWLARHGVGPGNLEPSKVPYYILLIGSPNRIPFSFQYLLDVEYAVGRLDFGQDGDAYGRYVASLIDYEEAAAAPHDRAAVFFGTRHPFDDATQLSADHLVRPLADSFRPGGRFAAAVPNYTVHPPILEQSATKATLGELLAGGGAYGRPALVFSATHGIGGWPRGHPDQQVRHGALLCQDWPGLGQIGPRQYFAAADLPSDARVHGLVAFLFACYGGGTPQLDAFRHKPDQPPPQIADEPFVAALPKRLLGHPEGAALAVIGHIERAWGYSFVFGREAQLLPFQNAIGRILAGQPVGHAMKDFNEKYAALSANLSGILEGIGFGDAVGVEQLAGLWTERNDAQNYVLLGDPAVSLKAG